MFSGSMKIEHIAAWLVYLCIGQFHVRIQEYIKVLIAVTSQLDAVIVCINVLYPMEN